MKRLLPDSTVLAAALALPLLLFASACDKDKEEEAKEGWHCFAFEYQGKRRVHCEATKEKCGERKKEVADLGEDFTDCQATDQVFCFQTYQEDNPRVCTPTRELCDYTRELHARGLKRRILDYGECYELGEEEPPEPKAPGEAQGGASESGESEAEGSSR